MTVRRHGRLFGMLLLICLLTTMQTMASAEERAEAPEDVWSLWTFTGAINIDGEFCTPEECGGAAILGMKADGAGFLYRENTGVRFEWTDNGSDISLSNGIRFQ